MARFRDAASREHLRAVSATDRVGEDVSTGDEFQDKMEDDLYQKKEEEAEPDPVSVWTGRIMEIVLMLVVVFCMVIGCVALFRWVF